MRLVLGGTFLSAALAAAGCGAPPDSSRPPDEATASAADSAPPKRYAASDLPQVAERLPPLDDGRVEFAPPQEWRILSRDSRYLARFVKGKEDNSLPRITVSAMPAEPGFEDVTEENVAEFAVAMQKRSEGVTGRKMLEPERPIILGDVAWSRHVRYLKARSGHAPLQSLATARGGRLYVIELTVAAEGDSSEKLAQAILAYRDQAYAVAASWKFLGHAEEPAAEAPAGKSALEEGSDAPNGTAEKNPPPAEQPATGSKE